MIDIFENNKIEKSIHHITFHKYPNTFLNSKFFSDILAYMVLY